MRRQESHHEYPEYSVVHQSEIEAAAVPHFSRGYWSRTLKFLKLLDSGQALRLDFSSGMVPRGTKSSIYAAAARERIRVSVHLRQAAVYICRAEPEAGRRLPIRLKHHCVVCGGPIDAKPGAGKQYVCSGTGQKKSECQKTLRLSRERGISINEAKRRRQAWRDRFVPMRERLL